MSANVYQSLFLSQAYQDAWEDYQRLLHDPTFLGWDYVLLTASNEQQAEGYRAQLQSRTGALPEKTRFVVLPDEGGQRVGSGGATLSAIRYIATAEGGKDPFSGKRILVIHSGGDSKRIPQYSALGKLFSPVPHRLPDGRPSTLFDELMIAVCGVASRIREGMLILSGDVLLLFNSLLIDFSGHDAAALSFKEPVSTGKNHGVFLNGENGRVRRFLHKQSEDALRAVGAVNDADQVDIDTGAVIFSADILRALYRLVEKPSDYSALVNERVRLSLYGDLQYVLAEDSTLETFYEEQPEGTFTPELKQARTKVWEALRPFRMKLIRLAPAKFIHFGTSPEILRLLHRDMADYAGLGWSARVNTSFSDCAAGYNAVLADGAEVGDGCYLEASYVHHGASVGEGSILSFVDVETQRIPAHVVVHALKQRDGRFVCRIFGVEDNPKQERLFGVPLDEAIARVGLMPDQVWKNGEPRVLWTARLYPVADTVGDALNGAIALYAAVCGEKPDMLFSGDRKSLREGFADADPDAIIAWNKRMAELVMVDRLEKQIAAKVPASACVGQLKAPLTPIQREWLDERLQKADPLHAMRLAYYAGMALGGVEGDEWIRRGFSILSQAVQDNARESVAVNDDAHIVVDRHEVQLPLRVNWGGGWSDTPPYCHEQGGTVLNAAISVNGQLPVSVTLERIKEKKIVLDSRDMDAHGEFSTIEPLQDTGNPYDPFSLQKAALLACGILPLRGGSLERELERLGGGFIMRSQVNGIPKGSGLGTSSILAAGCAKCLFEFVGIRADNAKIYDTVLVMEQIMSTGGGWQDQVGGLTPGVKFTTSRPGMAQKLLVEPVALDPHMHKELRERFALIYTGQRRLARNLLRDVVGRYIGWEPETVKALDEIQQVAALMRFELQRGHMDGFSALLNRHWELSKTIDAGTSNTLIEQIFQSAEDLIDGKMICGAGGGGFLQVVLKKGVSRVDLQNRLKDVFSDTDINVWECRLI
jgi:fucokinase